MKFRKKPVIIEAEQYIPGTIISGVCGCRASNHDHVHTAHAGQTVDLKRGDWVVPEGSGNGYYPIRDEDMKRLYDPVND